MTMKPIEAAIHAYNTHGGITARGILKAAITAAVEALSDEDWNDAEKAAYLDAQRPEGHDASVYAAYRKVNAELREENERLGKRYLAMCTENDDLRESLATHRKARQELRAENEEYRRELALAGEALTDERAENERLRTEVKSLAGTVQDLNVVIEKDEIFDSVMADKKHLMAQLSEARKALEEGYEAIGKVQISDSAMAFREHAAAVLARLKGGDDDDGSTHS